MTRKNRQSCIEICQAAGLTVHGIDRSGKHMSILCAEGTLRCSGTPSCPFWLKKVRRDARNLQRAWAAKRDAA